MTDTQQAPAGHNSLAGFTLDDIVTKRTVKPPKLLVYGPPGVGKTTFAAGARSPLILPTEDGLGVLDTHHLPLLTAYHDFTDAVKMLLSQKHSYKTIILDSVDNLEPIVWGEVRLRTGKGVEEYGFGKGFGYAAEVWREVIQGLDMLRDRGMCVIVIGHSDVVRFEDPEHGPYDTYGLRLHKRARPLLEDWADAVLFANYKTHVTETEGKFGQNHRRAIGSGERTLYTNKRPAFSAKNRYGLPDEMPLKWDTFYEAFYEAMGLSAPKPAATNPTETENTETATEA